MRRTCHFLRLATALIALLLAPSLAAATKPAASLDDWLQQFDDYFLAQMQKHKVPGGAYVIVQGDQILRVRPYGVRKQRSAAPVDIHTTFRLASVSKTFAASLAAKQVHQGHFKWQDSVVKYVPQLAFKTPGHAERLQVKDLLSHASGLVPNAYDNLIEAGQSLPKILPQFKKLKPLCEPGKCYGYQNVLYSMIEQVIEQTNPLDYESLMQQAVFDPLGMDNASLGRDAFMNNPNHATGHLKLKRGWYPKKPKRDYYNFPAAAGVNASIYDMGKWLIAQLGHRPDVLPPTVLNDMRTANAVTKRDLKRRQWRKYLKRAEYGLGWRLYDFNGTDLVYHGGWVAGFRADLAYAPNIDIGIAVLLNAESHAINYVTTHFWDMALKPQALALIDQAKPTPQPRMISPLLLRNAQVQPYRSEQY
ncbi:beta-lactamase family protein [Neiella marina]|uniref:Beta-lactamase family protein n=1 Tax=Neiella holothuriorum TaxID=2870530 RepID=A0ABS7EH66_9GAMM|nr:serine hydrolase domain-containing protein [Neiella holothuriorum]MBW8191691.1 beta-lactamase family protein [Neiella holothuriorum]